MKRVTLVGGPADGKVMTLSEFLPIIQVADPNDKRPVLPLELTKFEEIRPLRLLTYKRTVMSDGKQTWTEYHYLPQ